MSFTGTENQPIFIDLTQVAVSTGWTTDGVVATHESCNDGNVIVRGYTIVPGVTYRISVIVDSLISGTLFAALGGNDVGGIMGTGLYVAEITAITDEAPRFYANGNCQIRNFVIEAEVEVLPDDAQNTIAWAEIINKWTSFYTKAPEVAYSLFTKLYEFQDGNCFVAESGSSDRCNFFGTQYPATIWFSTNQQPSIGKLYQSVNYQANQLLITPPSGINTQGGQTSELIPVDFEQMVLADNVSPSVFVYQVESLFKASFMRSFPDLVEGDTLIGNYMQMGLQTTAPSGVLTLFSTEICYVHLKQNIR